MAFFQDVLYDSEGWRRTGNSGLLYLVVLPLYLGRRSVFRSLTCLLQRIDWQKIMAEINKTEACANG